MELNAFRILLWKTYFDKGYGLTSYFKYILAVMGAGAMFRGIELWWIFVIGISYGVVCFIIGKWWFDHKLIDVENEIANAFNPFQREVRAKLRNRKV